MHIGRLTTLIPALVNFVSYSLVQLGVQCTRVVPSAQNIALLFLLMWLAFRRSPRESRAGELVT